ncbi:prenyltransferase/squalene oxidase repeat-containing protein [Gemmata sp. JC717]|uniref:prenyltransferase/squalene oxidase repeat-containing protein n=1 Tax=Gemmata algarum TaxID=2975278 RepID=UPI0021BB29FE|nr:prenyltransferase/squalene oxidase repeat-containing protein [Gemmata algarum]MDY3555505.1 prenyltransferase/squalene oxidase repeat-containing protein [Gemmata algarum]
MIPAERLRTAYRTARAALLAERVPEGHWVGELSTSALSTATAVMALHLVNPFTHRELIDAGRKWLAAHQNADGGWGDTVKSFSNISTTMLCRAAFKLAGEKEYPETVQRVEEYLTRNAGALPTARAAAIRARYGKDHTFSVPILMTCAVAKLVAWDEVPRLPFELACLPQSWYRFAKMPVVSYALPALIAIGQCIHHHRRSQNPIRNTIRRLARGLSLKVLRRIQPSSGGYLEATPLTSFVVMALSSIRRRRAAAEQQVIDEGVRFLVNSARPDGSWPIDTNLATWVTTLSVNALVSAGDLDALDTKEHILAWLLKQQYKERHPYTGADPGGWAWTDLPGGVPDCDDTPGAMLAIEALAPPTGLRSPPTTPAGGALNAGFLWTRNLQNGDEGFPTFCRGWGYLPFDRSGCDLTAHALRAWGRTPKDLGSSGAEVASGMRYLAREQRPDGSWLPLWFGNQHAPDDINPVYGTARVLAAYRDLDLKDAPECRRGIEFLLSVQNADGGWGGAKGCPSSVEETALAVEVLLDLANGDAAQKGVAWLTEAVESDRFRDASPIGFYFAKLWYFEKLYPIIFTVAALGRAVKITSPAPAAGSA